MKLWLSLFLGVVLQVPFIKGDDQKWEIGHGASHPRPLPQEIMVDSINYIGLLLLHAHNEGNENNIAFSPYGATSVLVALAEGVQGAALKEIIQSTLLPLDVSATRIGLRDIHRHLKSYFIPQEGFLAGLTFSHENVTLNPPYEALLRFYGYDIDSFNNALYPDPYTTAPPISVGTSPSSAYPTDATFPSIGTSVIQSITPPTLTIDIQPSTIGTDSVSTISTTAFPAVSFNEDGSLTIDVQPTSSSLISDTSTVSPKRETLETSLGSTVEKPLETFSTITTDDKASLITNYVSSTISDIITNTNPASSSTTESSISSTFVTNQPVTLTESTSAGTVFSTIDDATSTTSPEINLEVSTILTDSKDVDKEIENYKLADIQSNIDLINLSNIGSSLPPRSQKMIDSKSQMLNKFINMTKIHYAIQDNDDETQSFVTTPYPFFTSTVSYETEGLSVSTDDYLNVNSYTPSQEVYFTTDGSLLYSSQDLSYDEDNETVSTNTIYSVTTDQSIKEDFARLYDQMTAADSSKNQTTRSERSVIDYIIAKYHDRENKAYIPYGYPPPPPPPLHPHYDPNQLAFSVNGKYREPNVNFMTYDTVLPFRYISYLNALALTFPLDSTKYYLLLVLPVDEMGIDQLIKDLIPVNLKQIVYNLNPTRVKAIIPSFMLKGYVVLTPTLQKLGIKRIFEPRQADFSRMTNEPNIYVTNIEQAVTVTIRNYVNPETLPNYISRRQDPVEFKADHPFLYFVMDSEIHAVLMAGKIINPLNSRIR